MKPFAYAIMFITCSTLAACEYGPPAIANVYSRPARFTASFSEGSPFEGAIAQGSILWQSQKGRRLTSVTIVTADGARHVYSEAVLQRLRAQRKVQDELWIFGPSGLRLEDVRDIERIRKELPTPPKA